MNPFAALAARGPPGSRLPCFLLCSVHAFPPDSLFLHNGFTLSGPLDSLFSGHQDSLFCKENLSFTLSGPQDSLFFGPQDLLICWGPGLSLQKSESWGPEKTESSGPERMNPGVQKKSESRGPESSVWAQDFLGH